MPNAEAEAKTPRASQTAWARVRPWLLAPLLAVVAIAVQFAVDVPRHAMIERDSKTEKKPAKTTAAARTRPARAAPKKKWRSRGASYTKRLRKTWATRPISEEPRNPRFAEHHEALLRAVARKAEAAVAPANEPVSAQVEPTCHTIRCELQLCARPKLVNGMADYLPKFQIAGRPLWHELREVEAQGGDKQQVCRRWTIDFAIEGADAKGLQLTR